MFPPNQVSVKYRVGAALVAYDPERIEGIGEPASESGECPSIES